MSYPRCVSAMSSVCHGHVIIVSWSHLCLGRVIIAVASSFQVLMAAGKGEWAVKGHREAEKLQRIFIVVPTAYSEDDIREIFKVGPPSAASDRLPIPEV